MKFEYNRFAQIILKKIYDYMIAFYFDILSTNRAKRFMLLKALNWLYENKQFYWKLIRKKHNSRRTNDKLPKNKVDENCSDTMCIQTTGEYKAKILCNIQRKLSQFFYCVQMLSFSSSYRVIQTMQGRMVVHFTTCQIPY